MPSKPARAAHRLRVGLSAVLLSASFGGLPGLAAADLERPGRTLDPTRPLLLAADDDDDDEDDTPDSRQAERIPADDVIELLLRPRPTIPIELSAIGGVRLLQEGRPVQGPLIARPGQAPLSVGVQAVRPTTSSHPAALLLSAGDQTQRFPVHAVAVSFLDASNQTLDAARDALGIAQRVTNDRSLPRALEYDARSVEPHDVRLQVFDALAPGKRIKARLQSLAQDGARVRSSLTVTLSRPGPGMAFRSRFIRLVGDDVDATARGLSGQVLKVGIRDRVRLVYETREGNVEQELRVGRPGDERGPLAARQVRLRVTVLRLKPGGPPVVGTDDLSALRIVRDEVAIANEIWLQCMVTLGPPAETSVQLADPPGTTLLSVADGDGLPARGGAIRLRVDGQAVSPIEIPAGSSPQDTALRIEHRLRALGLQAWVTINPATVFGAGPSADVMVRRGDGEWVVMDQVPGVPLTTDPQQRIVLGSVDLGDGLEEFDNMTAQSGTLEERTLVKALTDDDPSTVDLFIINRFTHGTRQGEAFIAASSGAIVNTLVLDRNGLRQRQTAWTLSHELGHVLLNQPLHPDNIGTDVPMLLMDSDNNRGTVNGPKRLLASECSRARYESEVRAVPPLLQAYEPRPDRSRPALR